MYISEHKKRTSNTQLLNTFYKELRHLCLSLNISQTEYLALNDKLSHTIKL